MTHSFILRKEEAPVCVACNVVLTVKHILIECADLLETRKKYFEEKSMYSLFRTPQWEAADAEIKVPSDENSERRGSPF